jgi:hypothetical protein
MTAARLEYARGQEAFERGEYRQAVSYLAEAVQLAQAATPLGGGNPNLAGECLQRRRSPAGGGRSSVRP